MPKIKAPLTVNYEQQGSGDPLILIPFLAADHACYAFQVAEFAKHFTCISVDLRGTGESDDPGVEYTTETLADDVARFMEAIGIAKAHIFGLSLGGAVGLWLGAKYPEKVKSLSLHGTWTKTGADAQPVVEGWKKTARELGSVQEMVIQTQLPWCLTRELYAARPEYIEALADFIRSRPPMTIESFVRQSNAVLSHDVEAQLGQIVAPTQVTFGRLDRVTPLAFAERLQRGIRNCELSIFEGCAHAPLYEKVEEFNRKVLGFLQVQAGAAAA